MTLLDLRNWIRKYSGDRLASNQVISQSVFLNGIINNSVIPDLVGRHDWSFKEAVETASFAQGTFRIQMPSTLQDVKTLILHTGSIGTTRLLAYKSARNFFETWPDPNLEAQDFPTHYTWVNREIWLNYPMNGAYSLRMIGLRRFTELVTDSETPSWMDDDKHMLLAYAGAGFVYASVEDKEAAAPWFKLYENGVEQWWGTDQQKEPTHLGQYKPSGNRDPLGEYWKQPFVRSVS